MIYIFKCLVIAFAIKLCCGRIRNLHAFNDDRKNIILTTFGLYKGGLLNVQLQNFVARPVNKNDVFGFSLYHTLDNTLKSDVCDLQDHCLLQSEYDPAVVRFVLDFNHKIMEVECSGQRQRETHIYKSREDIYVTNPEPCEALALNLVPFTNENLTYYNTSFVLYVASDSEEGFYGLCFHSCPNYISNRKVTYDFSMVIVEENGGGNFLSAGEMPLPTFYRAITLLFFFSGCFWAVYLKQSRHPVFKIHYFMAILAFLQAISLAFYTVNYYCVEIIGAPLATWLILFYIVHFCKGILLYVTLILIGTGWTFIKHSLGFRDKVLLAVVIPLQVLRNVAEIIFKETASSEYNLWYNVFIFADLSCCMCILFPGIWSIRHVRNASEIYGKAAVNLKKLFRFFYVMVVGYIYFTRVVRYLIKISVSFEYSWAEEVFCEMITYVFYILVAYKFRPAALNPYFCLPSDDEDVFKVIRDLEGTNSKRTVITHSIKNEDEDQLLTENK